MERRFSYDKKVIENFIDEVRRIDGMSWKFLYINHHHVGLNCDKNPLPSRFYIYRLEASYPSEISSSVIMDSRFDEAHCHLDPFAATPNFPIAMIKRESQIFNDLYIVGVDIDFQVTEAKRFNHIGRQMNLSKLEDAFSKIPHLYLPTEVR